MTPFMKRMRKGTCLRPESARAILHAERYAYAARRPLNVFITMKFPKLSRSGDRPYDVFRKKFWENTRRRWNTMVKENRSFSPFDAITVFENPPTANNSGRRHHGPLHVHWMLRWPFRKCGRLMYFLRRQFHREFGVAPPSSVRMQRVRYGPRAAAYLAKKKAYKDRLRKERLHRLRSAFKLENANLDKDDPVTALHDGMFQFIDPYELDPDLAAPGRRERHGRQSKKGAVPEGHGRAHQGRRRGGQKGEV